MKLGIDLDNTIALYDHVFCKYARKFFGLTGCQNKTQVANHLRNSSREKDWTWLQGEVYGKYMDEAIVAPGFIDAVESNLIQSLDIDIVSHRTKLPSSGADYDMHLIAHNWLKNKVFRYLHNSSRISVNFLETLSLKISFIAEADYSIFIDDLVHVLNHENFPAQTRGVLFTNGVVAEGRSDSWIKMKCWGELNSLISDVKNEKT